MCSALGRNVGSYVQCENVEAEWIRIVYIDGSTSRESDFPGEIGCLSEQVPWPDFDFRSLPLSSDSRKQLFGIYDYVRSNNKVPPQRAQLLHLIAKAAFDPGRGAYL